MTIEEVKIGDEVLGWIEHDENDEWYYVFLSSDKDEDELKLGVKSKQKAYDFIKYGTMLREMLPLEELIHGEQ